MSLSGIAWNLAGLALPLLAALLCMPPLLGGLGAETFGLLSLVWAATAISGLFDLGIGRACTKLVAEHRETQRKGALRPLAAQALWLSLAGGVLGSLLLLLTLATDLPALLRAPSTTAHDLQRTVILLALLIPLQTLGATLRGVAEGLQRFREVSLLRMLLGSSSFLAPWVLLPLQPGLPLLVAALLLTRALGLLAWFWVARLPKAPNAAPPTPTRLLASGGWLSLSAIISPLMVQADRFAIAALVSAAAVGAYTLPFDIVTQLLILPTAVGTVAYPALAALRAKQDHGAQRWLWTWGWRMGVVMASVCAISAWGLQHLLPWWLGTGLPSESIRIGQWLCLGVWVNAMGSLFYAWLHAQGRYRATALLHLLELPLYFGLLVLLLHSHGVIGAAWAWVARVSFDTLMLARLSLNNRVPRSAMRHSAA